KAAETAITAPARPRERSRVRMAGSGTIRATCIKSRPDSGRVNGRSSAPAATPGRTPGPGVPEAIDGLKLVATGRRPAGVVSHRLILVAVSVATDSLRAARISRANQSHLFSPEALANAPAPQNRVRAKAIFASPFKLIWVVGPVTKTSRFRFSEIR